MTAPQRPVPLPLVLLGVLGVLLLLAVAGVLFVQATRFPSRPTVSEVKQHLKALYVTQKAYVAEKDVYSEDMERVGFLPERRNRYSYFSSSKGRVLPMPERDRPAAPYHAVPADPDARRFRGAFSSFAETGCPLTGAPLPDGTTAGLGVTPAPGQEGNAIFIGAAAANLDDDATVDCWSIATVPRVASDGTRILAGEPYNEVNDVMH